MGKNSTFECPMCGNPLNLSNKPVIKCMYCEQLVVPRGYGQFKGREPELYRKKNKERGLDSEED